MKKTILTVALLFAVHCAWGQKAVAKADILKDVEWKKVYDLVVPDAALIENLRTRAAGLKADVYFAYWCSDSLNHVPVFLKILDALNVPEFTVCFYEVERKSTPGQKHYVADLEIERIPTFIFYANGVELGRIIENPRASILEDMLSMLL